MYSRAADITTGVLSDHIGKLMIYKSKKEYPQAPSNQILQQRTR
jgi:hypothetical protein